ncbi:AraC family HTH transcriptional regulator [Gottschalkia acidurici 9a]|uniref:AraC family HTH transcriptional regulator n=1 Tax=Gottschalkia acidurici (strain ATCC 7906 / DSM 604 / BCRC 14475 / CIP 104303 / KCTC 5404 / NCIMB 10678 / 9a) TaxID=1128398 RepID=K0AXI0_GOTA9|nr:helix-turn-helix domain-containing protein [Gottschalkia acidurici]AFS77477.1 AraC family HTH transcriptional regulator [Gottschalkia acidurici 9a]
MKEKIATSIVNPSLFYKLIDIKYFTEWNEEDKIPTGYNILIITSGKGVVSIDNMIFSLERGDCFILTPDMTNNIKEQADELCFYLLTFDVVISEEIKSNDTVGNLKIKLPCEGKVDCAPFSQCIDLVENIFKDCYRKNEIVAFNNHVRFQQLLLYIFQHNDSRKETDIYVRVSESIEYIKQNFKDILTVDELSIISDVNRNRYTSLFKKITGQVPLNYINEIRINRAKRLLLMTDDKLFDIARNVGFNDEYYFSRRFKQTVGISPGQYRYNNRQNIRIFAPYLEDFLLSLGVTPIAQCLHSNCGKQDYLGLNDIPALDILREDLKLLSNNKPDFIMIDEVIKHQDNNRFKQLAPTYVLSHPGEDWRSILYTVADLVGKIQKVEDVIGHYEEKVSLARRILGASVREQTVACLRISSIGVDLYSGENQGYTGPILYGDLKLKPHPLVQQLAFKERRVRLTPKLLSQLNADHLFITFDKHYSQSEGDERKILNNPLWKSLLAVKNNHVYEVDFMTWMNYGVISHSKKIDDVLKALA